MDFDEGIDFSRRVTEMHHEDLKLFSEMIQELGKALIQAIGRSARG